MDPNQFDTYVGHLVATETKRADDAEKARKLQKEAEDFSKAINLVGAIVNQTAICDGSTQKAVRDWIRDINLASTRNTADLIEIVARTVSGPLRTEVERFIDEQKATYRNERAAIPWRVIREHVERTFLDIDELQSKRDALKREKQGPFDSEAAFIRRFRDLAEEGYPTANRNDDQNELIVTLFLQNLQSDRFAQKIVSREHPPRTLNECVTALQGACVWQNNYTRLHRPTTSTTQPLGRVEEDMDISGVQGHSGRVQGRPRGVTSQNDRAQGSDKLDKIIKSQEKLSTRLAKIELNQSEIQKKIDRPNASSGRMARPRSGPPATTGRNWQGTNRPARTQTGPAQAGSCFNCGGPGHFRRDCPDRRRQSNNSRPQNRSNWRQYPKNY